MKTATAIDQTERKRLCQLLLASSTAGPEWDDAKRDLVVLYRTTGYGTIAKALECGRKNAVESHCVSVLGW